MYLRSAFMSKRILYFILLVLLLADTAYSFMQHQNQPLDGDLPGGTLPADDVKPVLSDPLGISVITEDRTYPNPNRFFSHWPAMNYFRAVPLWMQSFTDPVDSIYLSCALAKTLTQLAIILILAYCISGTKNIASIRFLLAAILITPLFQTNGYRTYMGVIDPASTYVFFYALPAVFLLLYFAPFIKEAFHKEKISRGWLFQLLWLPLALVVSLGGPLNPGVVLVITAIVFVVMIVKNYKAAGDGASLLKAVINIPRRHWLLFVPVAVLSVYSLYLGLFNSISSRQSIPLAQLYAKLPVGLFNILTGRPGFLLLLGTLLVNTVIIRMKFDNTEGRRILSAFKWIGIGALIYLLMLPLGGAREYRPYVIRYDTFIPVTLALMFIFGASTLYLLRQVQGRIKMFYVAMVAGVLLVFTIADEPEFERNDCERQVLNDIYRNKLSVIPADRACSVLTWNNSHDGGQGGLREELLKLWRVIPPEKD